MKKIASAYFRYIKNSISKFMRNIALNFQAEHFCTEYKHF